MCRDPPSRLERRSRTIGSASWRPTKLTTNSVTCSDTKLYTDNAHDQPNYTPCVYVLSTPRPVVRARICSSRAGARCEPYTPSGPSAMPSRPCAPHARIGITNLISMRNIIYFKIGTLPTIIFDHYGRGSRIRRILLYLLPKLCMLRLHEDVAACRSRGRLSTPAVDCRPPRVELSQSATACRTMDDALSQDRHWNLLAARRAF